MAETIAPKDKAFLSMKVVQESMDAHAKRIAVAFGFYVLGADPNDPEMGGIEVMEKTYNSFIEQQNKQQ